MLMMILFTLGVGYAYGDFMEIKDVHYKFDLFDGYWPLHKKVSEDQSFEYTSTDKELNCDVYSQRNDPRFCVLADRYGNIVAIRLCYIKADLPKRAEKNNMKYPYKMEDHDMFQSETYWGTEVYCTTVLFYCPEVLKKGGTKDTKGVVVKDVYIKLNKKWTKISRDQCDAEKLGFTKQGCFPGMGLHYFYNMTEHLDCHDFLGMFLLYESCEMVGMGFIPMGTFTCGPDKDWFEDPSESVVKMIVTNRPTCLTEWVSNYGTTSMHIFFKKFPRLITCVWPFQKECHCDKH